MPVSLDQILQATRARVAAAKAQTDLIEMERLAGNHAPRGFRRALEAKRSSGTAIIAELKKASPSKGLIRVKFNAAELAIEMENSGAAALSVLTDEEFFQGSLANLRAASAAAKLPCIRKDFIIDEFQLLEARANSADAVLLIVAALAQSDLKSLFQRARALGLDVLCEVHDEDELKRALDAGCDLIGVNTRDLRTFKVDPQTAFRLADLIPENVMSVAESGIRSADEIAELRRAGYRAFLVGETLMRAEQPGKTLRGLLRESAVSSTATS
jgi:indole-3-glycerol phosphate synthase